MPINLKEAFNSKEAEDAYSHFYDIENPRHPRQDLCGLLMLEEILPGKRGSDIISAATHDEIFLNVDMEKLAEVITLEQIIDLARCGIRYDGCNDGLCMFV